MRMSAYGRKRTFGLSLNGCFLTAALEEKADIRVLELRARVNGRNRPRADIGILAILAICRRVGRQLGRLINSQPEQSKGGAFVDPELQAL